MALGQSSQQTKNLKVVGDQKSRRCGFETKAGLVERQRQRTKSTESVSQSRKQKQKQEEKRLGQARKLTK